MVPIGTTGAYVEQLTPHDDSAGLESQRHTDTRKAGDRITNIRAE